MAKKLKTGDVKRFKRGWFVDDHHQWANVTQDGLIEGWCVRRTARNMKNSEQRIARILSIGPKYVTVRISK